MALTERRALSSSLGVSEVVGEDSSAWFSDSEGRGWA